MYVVNASWSFTTVDSKVRVAVACVAGILGVSEGRGWGKRRKEGAQKHCYAGYVAGSSPANATCELSLFDMLLSPLLRDFSPGSPVFSLRNNQHVS